MATTSSPARAGGIALGPAHGPGAGRAIFGMIPIPDQASTSGPSSGPGTGSPSTSSPGPPNVTSGGTSSEPGGGPTSSPGGSTGSTSGTGSTNGSTGNGSSNGYYVDPGFNSAIAGSFLNILQNATSPDAMNAQNIILRRIALEGDVIGSRVPPPKNITEIGGYLNYLTTTNQPEMRSQTLAGILGVAGPNPPLGWLAPAAPSLTMVSVQNDRPAGTAQATIPLAFVVRSDFADALKAALATLHAQGCMLPFQNTGVTLPQGAPGATLPADMLPYLGRTLDVAGAAALVDPTTDPVALIRASGTSNPFEIGLRVLTPGTVSVTPANYDAVQCTGTTCTTVSLSAAPMVPIAGALQSAGFYEATPMPMPASSASTAWAHLTNITGLVKGVTKLGDELALLYSWTDIQNSVFAGSLSLVWDGTTFSTPS